MRQFLKCSRRRTSSDSSSSSRQHSRLSNLLRVKRICIGVSKMDSDIAGSKQESCNEISNEMKSICRSRFVGRRFSLKGTSRTYNQPKKFERRSARRTALLVEQGCKYSHIPMTRNQELSLDTEHETRTKAMQ